MAGVVRPADGGETRVWIEPEAVLDLQRRVGNRSVARMLMRAVPGRLAGAVLQRVWREPTAGGASEWDVPVDGLIWERRPDEHFGYLYSFRGSDATIPSRLEGLERQPRSLAFWEGRHVTPPGLAPARAGGTQAAGVSAPAPAPAAAQTAAALVVSEHGEHDRPVGDGVALRGDAGRYAQVLAGVDVELRDHEGASVEVAFKPLADGLAMAFYEAAKGGAAVFERRIDDTKSSGRHVFVQVRVTPPRPARARVQVTLWHTASSMPVVDVGGIEVGGEDRAAIEREAGRHAVDPTASHLRIYVPLAAFSPQAARRALVTIHVTKPGERVEATVHAIEPVSASAPTAQLEAAELKARISRIYSVEFSVRGGKEWSAEELMKLEHALCLVKGAGDVGDLSRAHVVRAAQSEGGPAVGAHMKALLVPPQLWVFDSCFAADQTIWLGDPKAPVPRSVRVLVHECGHAVAAGPERELLGCRAELAEKSKRLLDSRLAAKKRRETLSDELAGSAIKARETVTAASSAGLDPAGTEAIRRHIAALQCAEFDPASAVPAWPGLLDSDSAPVAVRDAVSALRTKLEEFRAAKAEEVAIAALERDIDSQSREASKQFDARKDRRAREQRAANHLTSERMKELTEYTRTRTSEVELMQEFFAEAYSLALTEPALLRQFWPDVADYFNVRAPAPEYRKVD